ncbi:hypothetical protein CLOM_g15541 [Closterium sp. NIES-68]|nr:hypothetical protein CLOM_g15541 [Closterium sp. NIES-68]GJP59021.1 hypothetical protein CLOP_g7079 [Closterium sp. NIES-67]
MLSHFLPYWPRIPLHVGISPWHTSAKAFFSTNVRRNCTQLLYLSLAPGITDGNLKDLGNFERVPDHLRRNEYR